MQISVNSVEWVWLDCWLAGPSYDDYIAVEGIGWRCETIGLALNYEEGEEETSQGFDVTRRCVYNIKSEQPIETFNSQCGIRTCPESSEKEKIGC